MDYFRLRLHADYKLNLVLCILKILVLINVCISEEKWEDIFGIVLFSKQWREVVNIVVRVYVSREQLVPVIKHVNWS